MFKAGDVVKLSSNVVHWPYTKGVVHSICSKKVDGMTIVQVTWPKKSTLSPYWPEQSLVKVQGNPD